MKVLFFVRIGRIKKMYDQIERPERVDQSASRITKVSLVRTLRRSKARADVL